MELNKLFIFPLLLLLLACQSQQTDNPRERTSLDLDWKFMLGNIKGAEQENFDDTDWRTLDVPHDWSIEGSYDEANETGIAGAFLPAGIGWYRKTIEISDLDQNDKYFIEFDGVYMNSDVWINGNHLGRRPYGYISFGYDLTPFLRQGQNFLAVRVDHSMVPSGRWYTGSGIYRHVWLTKTSTAYIPQWGTSVKTSINESGEADISLEIEFRNDGLEEKKFKVRSVLRDKNGKIVDRDDSRIEISGEQKIRQEFKVQEPNLWSPDNPEMYVIETILTHKEKVIDRYITDLGIRSIEIRGSKGFFLNGESIKFKGLSNHHDAGPVGAAVPDDVLYRRLKLLKDMGCNALRTTHNPFSPEFYTMCDTMGFMVMDEAFDGWWTAKAKHDYGNYFDEWWQKDLGDFIKRDRNHPSVVIWSIGNEVRGFNADQQKKIVEFVKQLDDTRPVTQGSGYSAPHIDVAGFNGHGEFKGVLENYHKNNPERAIIGTEITHTLQTRGVYRTNTWYRTKDNPAPWERPGQFKKMESRVYKIPNLSESEVFGGITHKYQSSYDNSVVRIGVRDDWNRVEERDYYLGNFRWTGFDYLGESFGWPARTANFGIIDLAGFPKDHYYLYQSLWSSKPMVHLLPHWTHPGREGVEIPVVAYTNCETAELFLNGKSLGEKEMGVERQIVWQVPYEKGELKVLAKNDGEVIAEKVYQTAGSAAKVQMIVDRKTILSNRTDVVHIETLISDQNQVMLPDADHLIEFEISGPAKLLGVENGDILDLAPHKVPSRKVFMGKCLLLIQSNGEQGEIEVKAKSGNLETAVVKILAESK